MSICACKCLTLTSFVTMLIGLLHYVFTNVSAHQFVELIREHWKLVFRETGWRITMSVAQTCSCNRTCLFRECLGVSVAREEGSTRITALLRYHNWPLLRLIRIKICHSLTKVMFELRVCRLRCCTVTINKFNIKTHLRNKHANTYSLDMCIAWVCVGWIFFLGVKLASKPRPQCFVFTIVVHRHW